MVFDASSPDIGLIGLLVMILNIFLFVFFVYIFPFFVYFISGTKLYGILRVTILFIFSFFATFFLAFLAAYTLSFGYIISAISAGFIVSIITGLALISGYSIFEHRYPIEHKWIPYIISSIAAAAYMLYNFVFPLKDALDIHSYIVMEYTGADNFFQAIYRSMGFFQEYYGNVSLGLSYIGYFLEIFVIGVILFFVIAIVMEWIER